MLLTKHALFGVFFDDFMLSISKGHDRK